MLPCLQLSEGLSSEYIKRSDREGDEKAAKFNADRQIYSKYYVHQVLQQGEESLRDAWTKASHAARFSAFTQWLVVPAPLAAVGLVMAWGDGHQRSWSVNLSRAAPYHLSPQ